MEYTLELDMKFGGQLNVKRVASPLLQVAREEDMQAIYAAFEKEFSEAYSPLGLNPDAGVEIEAFVLKASLPQPHPERPTQAAGTPRPGRREDGPSRRDVLGRRRTGEHPRLRDVAPGCRQRVRWAGADRIR